MTEPNTSLMTETNTSLMTETNMTPPLETNGKKKVEKRKVSELKDHPRQAMLFGEPTETEVKALAEVIKRDGFNVPVEILPDGMLICGHRRTRAARLLRMTEIDAWVRDDLAAQGAAAVERRLIEDNLTRQNLDPLAQARCAVALKQLARGSGDRRLSDTEAGQLREEIGRRLNLSGRHVSRLLRVIECVPVEVQHAVSANKLSMSDAYAVAGLAPEKLDLVARLLREGADPKDVVTRYRVKKDGRHRKGPDAKAAFVKSLRRGLEDLEGRVAEVANVTPDEKQALLKCQKLIEQLLKADDKPAAGRGSQGGRLGAGRAKATGNGVAARGGRRKS